MQSPDQPPRTPWQDFPDVLIHASESAVKQHPAYSAAKSGHGFSATALVNDTMSELQNQVLVNLLRGHTPTLVSAHAYEREGINAIPEAFAVEISKAIGWPHDTAVAQVNVVAHTGADGFSRLARQAEFTGAAVSLTGKPHSAKLALSPARLIELRLKHGTQLENWWIERFAHAFDALTESEARYLARTETADIVRNRIADSQQAGIG